MSEYPEVFWCNRDDDMIHFSELQTIADDDVKYLRADTCTPNAELEKLPKPIESAPGDHQKILVYTERTGWVQAKWDGTHWETFWEWMSKDEPTHWLPLPSVGGEG